MSETQPEEPRYLTAAEVADQAAEITRLVGRWGRGPQMARPRPTRTDDHGWARAFAAARQQEHR